VLNEPQALVLCMQSDAPGHPLTMGLEGIVSKRRDVLSLRALAGLDQEQEPERTSSETRSGRGLGLLNGPRRAASTAFNVGA
jgi:hypothetical protein